MVNIIEIEPDCLWSFMLFCNGLTCHANRLHNLDAMSNFVFEKYDIQCPKIRRVTWVNSYFEKYDIEYRLLLL